jgi:hypothetical protein
MDGTGDATFRDSVFRKAAVRSHARAAENIAIANGILVDWV